MFCFFSLRALKPLGGTSFEDRSELTGVHQIPHPFKMFSIGCQRYPKRQQQLLEKRAPGGFNTALEPINSFAHLCATYFSTSTTPKRQKKERKKGVGPTCFGEASCPPDSDAPFFGLGQPRHDVFASHSWGAPRPIAPRSKVSLGKRFLRY